MAEPVTIARPYAEAAFAIADESGRRAEWSVMLAELAAVASDPRVRAAIADPNLPAARAAGLVIGILAGRLTAEAENFVRVLAENGRLALLPQVRAQYEVLRNAREGVVEAEIQSAFELEAAQLADLVARLENRTGRTVKASVRVDRELIGGVRIVLGDKVIDGSVRSQLAALEAALRTG